jgi:hypothetical protein
MPGGCRRKKSLVEWTFDRQARDANATPTALHCCTSPRRETLALATNLFEILARALDKERFDVYVE